MQPIQAAGKYRIPSIDILRGAIMLIMALDHTRDFFHESALLQQPTDLASTTPALFFTRWITHFCAPGFLFLSGIAAALAEKRRTAAGFSSFLIKRGLWLVLVELVVMTFILTFNPTYSFIFLAVLWAIGWSMVILGLLVRTSRTVIAIVGVLLFFGHNCIDLLHLPGTGAGATTLDILLRSPGTALPVGNHIIVIAYAILPWTGILLLGYLAGKWFQEEVLPAKRRRKLLLAGMGLTGLFLVLRLLNGYGDPAPWAQQKNVVFSMLSFLNTTKYPASLQFSAMTLGPLCLLLCALDRHDSKFARWLSVYGKVPFFYFVVHFLLIHLLCVLAFFASGYGLAAISDPNSPFLFRPVQFGFSLAATYGVWFVVLLLMYYPSRWFGKFKATHRQNWVSYL